MNVAVVSLSVVCAALIAWRVSDVARARRRRPEPSSTRILFPFIGRALSRPVLDATLRLARADGATLVPAYLVRVPLYLPLAAPLPVQCGEAMPLLEAIERRARHEGVAVDARIERGRTYRHALRELLSHEQRDRIVIAADTTGTDGFDAADVAWLLDHATGEILVLRPAHDRLIRLPAESAAPSAATEKAQGADVRTSRPATQTT
jgi:hypothetical protein